MDVSKEEMHIHSHLMILKIGKASLKSFSIVFFKGEQTEVFTNFDFFDVLPFFYGASFPFVENCESAS